MGQFEPTPPPPRHIKVNISEKVNFKRSNKFVALSNLGIYYTWKNIKMSYENIKLKILALMWNEKIELPDGLHSISDIQDYFEYILKNMEK